MLTRPKILIFCVGGPSRSLMAQGFLQKLAGDKFFTASAATETVIVNPLAIQVMREAGIDISSQNAATAREILRQHFTHVIAICEMTKERCPVYPFAKQAVTWNVPNPAVSDEADDRAAKFRSVRDSLAAKAGEYVTNVFGNAA